MPLSLKAKLETWGAALRAYDDEDFETALKLFSRIPKSSIILTSICIIHAALGEHEIAVERFIEATLRDPYLAVAYFQCGVSNFLLARYDLAYCDFREAYRHLRDNQTIDYEQIGLSFKLYPAEVLFNRGLCLVCLDQVDKGLADLEAARRLHATKDHEIIGMRSACAGGGIRCSAFRAGFATAPPRKSSPTQRAKITWARPLIAAIDLHATTTGFAGAEQLRYREGRSASSEEARGPPVAHPLPRSASLNDAPRSGDALRLNFRRPGFGSEIRREVRPLSAPRRDTRRDIRSLRGWYKRTLL
ncbi:hypothetical protein B0H14DRAFT_3664856 [Mycena olivaceomarginata]|nr:hypothetical protein B0H14DRAFT_3664856 [Mycena olivaceomarginata]